MALTLKVGDRFPGDAQLTDIAGARRSLEEIADGHPLILTFYRGYW